MAYFRYTIDNLADEECWHDICKTYSSVIGIPFLLKIRFSDITAVFNQSSCFN